MTDNLGEELGFPPHKQAPAEPIWLGVAQLSRGCAASPHSVRPVSAGRGWDMGVMEWRKYGLCPKLQARQFTQPLPPPLNATLPAGSSRQFEEMHRPHWPQPLTRSSAVSRLLRSRRSIVLLLLVLALLKVLRQTPFLLVVPILAI